MSRIVWMALLLCMVSVQPVAADPFVITPDVIYGRKDGMALTYDVIQHREANNDAAVVFMVSGGWVSSWQPPEDIVKEELADTIYGHFRKLVEKGYTLYLVRHGSSPRFKVPDAVGDVRRALRHIRHGAVEFGVDPERIGVMGGSAGGHLSLMLGTTGDQPSERVKDDVDQQSAEVAAVVAYFPPVDLRDVVGPSIQFPALNFDPDEAPSVSPIDYVSTGDAPTLLVHGDQDKLVELSHSERIHEAFTKNEVPSELIVIEGAGHGFEGQDAKQASDALLAWFDAHLLEENGADENIQDTKLNKGKTAFDDYIAAPDDSYEWEVVHKKEGLLTTTYVIDLKSQTWLSPDEVDRNVWQHWLTLIVPKAAKSNKAMLFVNGGGNGGDAPDGADPMIAQLAIVTKSVVADLRMIPNQPLVFNNDGNKRTEDDLIGYTWDQYLKTGDVRWPARFPMVKAVVRAMDTVEALTADTENAPNIDEFVVAGASKRGWTTWMAAAMDKRVVAIAPIVIDVLNANVSMKHHYSAYGFWAPAIGDYVHHKVTYRRNDPRYAELLQLVDPFAYRDRLTMPKCIINATGDQFFLPDSSQFYFDELPDEKHLCYVPNSEHSMNGTDALDALVAFHYSIINDNPRPEFSWTFPNDNTIVVKPETKPAKVLLWTATNPNERDFRVDTIGRGYKSQELKPNEDGTYTATVKDPEKGWSAYFVQLEYDVDAPTALRLTTPVRVVPDVLPFKDKIAPLYDEEAEKN